MLSHGNYSIFEPQEMVKENKEHFKTVLENFIAFINILWVSTVFFNTVSVSRYSRPITVTRAPD
jgi:hypothetical protein